MVKDFDVTKKGFKFLFQHMQIDVFILKGYDKRSDTDSMPFVGQYHSDQTLVLEAKNICWSDRKEMVRPLDIPLKNAAVLFTV